MTIKNTREFRSLDEDDTSVTNELLAPAIFGNSNVPEVFEHMIEDETYDDYGVGSGSRFIIKRAQIRKLDIYVNPPDFTMVEVQGVQNPFAPNALPEGLNSFPENGNGLVTAMAVDYDAWRNYGFKNVSTVKVPFLSDPNSQCAPYASMLLSRNRKNILRGSVTISGNEFMQPGEVVFLEDRQLLFYVNSVRHSFTFGSGFTTDLELSYGHVPGEYIPTTLDIIGKMIYNNRDIASYTIQRQSNSANENNIGTIIRDNSGNSESTYSVFNNQVINNILNTTSYIINSNNSNNNNIVVNLELRIYFDNSSSLNADLYLYANTIRDILIGASESNNKLFLPQNNVILSTINLDDEADRRSPSQKAIDAVRNNVLSLSQAISTTDNQAVDINKIKTGLFSNIVDCWLIIKQVDK